MTDDGSKQSQPVWPLPKFSFLVQVDDIEMTFQEVSGLDLESQPLEYRAGNSPVFSTIKMPGMLKSSNVTLKRGIFTNDDTLWDWFSQIKMNTITRKPVTISLMDERGKPTMVWKLHNAFPVKMSGTDLTSEGTEVAIETIEIAHEGLEIENV